MRELQIYLFFESDSKILIEMISQEIIDDHIFPTLPHRIRKMPRKDGDIKFLT